MRIPAVLLIFIQFNPAIGKINFSREIRPILNQNCLGCHGGVQKQGGVSFLYREEALSKGDSGKPTVVPGDPDSSEMVLRITSKDPDIIMPQPKHGAPLKPAEIKLIRQWIKEGAEWNNHWSFEKPVRQKIPQPSDTSWPKNEIDQFILSKLEEKELQPTPPANSDRLLRRIHLDLTGLPPTIDQLDDFSAAHQRNPGQAISTVIDALLADNAFGEKWATQWLDVARYADSEGLGADRRWTAWPYRDWVIRAINDDMPYNDFLTKQIAGDLLPNATLHDLIATKFHRLAQQNAEGGTDNEEFRVMATMDRVNTTWKGIQAITFECVQCHDHPYDPIRHDEYYKFLAFFNNSRDLDLNNHYPTLKIPNNTTDFARAQTFRTLYQTQHTNLQNQARQQLKKTSWHKVSQLTPTAEKIGTKTQLVDGYLEFLTEGNPTNNVTIDLKIPPPSTLRKITALKIHALPIDPKNAIHSGTLGTILSQISLDLIHPNQEKPESIPLAHIIGDDDFPIYPANKSLEKNNTGWGAFTHQYHPRSCVVILKNPIELPQGSTLNLKLTHKVSAPTGPLLTKRGRLELTDNPNLISWLNSPETQQLLKSSQENLQNYQKLSPNNLAIMQSLPPHLHRQTHTFIRGNWLTKDTPALSPNTPAILHPLAKENPTRLDLANWITSPNNPFTSRVLVTRVWEQLFGLGLVETLENFGSTGIPPTHPELLDHLALEFQTTMKYSLKSLIRHILSSATYQQSAKASSVNRKKDPRNLYLSRGPRNRLSAELVRDHHLASSGLLHKKLYGPPVYPPIPAGVWKPFSDKPWKAAPVGSPDRYRRALYTYHKRSIPFPGFNSFDAPTRETCSSRRLTSNTPLAALTTLNSESFAEMATALASRINKNPEESLTQKLIKGYRLATSTRPSNKQLQILQNLFNKTFEKFEEEPDEHIKVHPDPKQAAFVILASTLLNLDDTLSK